MKEATIASKQTIKKQTVLLDHGSGGKASHDLLYNTLLPILGNPLLKPLHDGAVLEIDAGRIAFSTDTFVVDPIFFPGGSIGDLAVNGTVNDLSMCGATPFFLSVGLVIEEGFSIADLERIARDMAAAAKKAKVAIVTGDTKVVPKGAADKLFINTAGIGKIPEGVNIAGHRAKPGDKILLSGAIADHGMAVLTQREGLSFEATILSDTASLNHMVERMLSATKDVHVLRDPTRGGVGTALNEIAGQSSVGIRIFEEKIPLKDSVSAICELLGFDPLYVANEGKLLAFVAPDEADAVLAAMREDPYGEDSCMIGEVVSDNAGKVFLETRIGGTRMVDMLTGEQLPRIC
jgi:hydrogenase expression/formation protein HypE